MGEGEGQDRLGGPYGDLHVYVIRGVVAVGDEVALGNDFLGTWIEGDTSFLFFATPSRDKIDFLLGGRSALWLMEEHLFSYEEWQGAKLEPLRVGNFFLVPPWREAAAEEGETRILLDPGVVFGTGIHPTTRDCLRAMAYLHRRVAFERVLDIGTGTGILAVAAARLGARRVWAVDLNPLCVKTAVRNAGLNHVQEIVHVIEGGAKDFLDKPAGLAVANIHYEVLKELVEIENFRKKPHLILSGLMRSQGRDIKSRLERFGLKILQEWDGEGTWVTMLVSARSDERLE